MMGNLNTGKNLKEVFSFINGKVYINIYHIIIDIAIIYR